MMRIPTKPAIILLTMVLGSPVLAGCETVKSWTGTSSRDDITVTNAPAEGMTAMPDNGGRGGYTQIQPVPPSDRDLRAMTSKLSGGAVEIYNVGDGSPVYGGSGFANASVPPVSSVQMPEGISLATDPRVTVYPLDGSNYPTSPSYGGWSGEATYRPSPAPVVPAGLTSAGPAAASIYFTHGSSRLGSGDKARLDEAAEVAKFAPVDRIRVEGHASRPTQSSDPIESRILNLKESMNRAYEVSRDLIRNGVPAEKIKTVGWGDTKPTGADDSQNRRVDVLTGAGQ